MTEPVVDYDALADKIVSTLKELNGKSQTQDLTHDETETLKKIVSLIMSMVATAKFAAGVIKWFFKLILYSGWLIYLAWNYHEGTLAHIQWPSP